MLCEDTHNDIAKYLSISDVYTIRKTCKFPILAKYIAALKVFKIWYFKKSQAWVKSILYNIIKDRFIRKPNDHIDVHVSDRHLRTLPNTSVPLLHFRNYAICTSCNYWDIDTALYLPFGWSGYACTPHVSFLCRKCSFALKIEYFDMWSFVYAPIYEAHYGDKNWYLW